MSDTLEKWLTDWLPRIERLAPESGLASAIKEELDTRLPYTFVYWRHHRQYRANDECGEDFRYATSDEANKAGYRFWDISDGACYVDENCAVLVSETRSAEEATK